MYLLQLHPNSFVTLLYAQILLAISASPSAISSHKTLVFSLKLFFNQTVRQTCFPGLVKGEKQLNKSFLFIYLFQFSMCHQKGKQEPK